MFKKSKKLLSGAISFALLMTMFTFTGLTVSAAGTIKNVGPSDSLQAAINNAHDGDTIMVAAGTYNAGQFLVLAAQEGITIQGSGIDSTIFKLTAVSDGFKVQADNVTLKSFTITTDAGANQALYGLRAQDINNLTVGNVKITNMKKTGFDINGVTNSNLSGLVAQNNGGYGISINQSYDVTVAGTTVNNGWGGVDVANKDYSTNTNKVTAGINIYNVASSESLRLNVENYISGIDIASGVTFNSTYMRTPITATASGITTSSYLATNVITVNPSLPVDLVARNYNNITDAIAAANSGDIINVAAGTYDAPLRITNKNITIQGVAGTIITSSVSPAAVDTPDYHGQNPIIFAEGSTLVLKNLTVKAGSIPQYGSIDGITANNSNITLDNVTVTNILNAEGYNGMQYGRGLTALGTSTVVVTNSSFDKFNKNGIHLIGSGVTANITNTTFTGVDNNATAAAQNGVVFMNGATGSVTGCNFTNFWYTGTADATATGVLAYDAGAGITLRNNKFINDQDPVDNVTDDNTTPPVVDATMNYWGSAAPDFASLITSPYVTHTLWYTNAAVTELNNAVYSVTLNETTSTLIVGEKLTLVATVAAGTDADKTVTWASSNEQVATVDSNGQVTAAGVGNATIIATAGSKTASDKVTVTATIPDQGTPGAAAPTISDNTTPLSSNPLTGDKGTAIPLIAALSCLLAIAGVTFDGIIRKKRRHE